ncbi:MAG: hypothetical protein R3F20_15810 [Planctomycetota bacterium]
MLQEKLQTGVLYYENEPLEGYLIEELAQQKRFATKGVFGAIVGDYVVSGNRLEVFLKFRGGRDLDAPPQEFRFHVEYPEFRQFLGPIDGKPNEYAFTKRTMKVEDEFQRLARFAIREALNTYRGKAGADVLNGKTIHVTEPRLPGLNPVLSIAGAMLDSLYEKEEELLNRAREEPEKWKVDSDILSDKDVQVNVYGGTFPNWKVANEEIRRTMTFVFGQKEGVLLQFNLQDVLRTEIRNYATVIGAEGLDAPDPNARSARTSGALGGRGRDRRRAAAEPDWSYEIKVELTSAGGDRMEVRAELRDWESGGLLAASKPYTVKRYFIEQGNLKFVKPETVAKEDLPDKFLDLLKRYGCRIPLARKELEAR